MSDEKIRITSEDIARVQDPTPLPSQPGQGFIPPSEGSSNPIPSSRAKRNLLVGGGGVALVFILILLFPSLGGRSVDSWTRYEKEELTKVFNTNPKAKSFIEDAQPSCKYTGATVKSVIATTIDGSQRAGKNGDNIAEEIFVVTFHWTGQLQDNGYTEVRFTYDKQANVLKKTEYISSNALVNLHTVDWYKVGFALGTLFGG